MLRINVHCPQRTWVGLGLGGGGRWGWPYQSSLLLSPSSAATRAGTSAINATREKMVVKYFMMKKMCMGWGIQGGKCNGMKIELAYLEAALYESENRRCSASSWF
jgi:hypothetical protein